MVSTAFYEHGQVVSLLNIYFNLLLHPPSIAPAAAGDGDGDDSKFMPNDKNNQSRNLGERASLAHRRRPTEEGHRGYYRARNEDRDDEDEDYEAGEGDKERVAGGEERRARMFKAARAMAEEIRGRIQEATQLTASCGIGPNFMLAKVCGASLGARSRTDIAASEVL